MALVRHFQKMDTERTSLHDDVEASYSTFERDGKGFVQINTYGRKTRMNPGKQSQTIQLDRDGAVQLISILQKAFRL